jgi:hypothetical protein
MKFTFATTAFAALLGLALAGTSVHAQMDSTPSSSPAPAATTPSTGTMAPTMTMKKTPYRGTITAIDTSANTITIQSKKGTMTLMINDQTKYKGGKALGDFAVGDKVSGSYLKDDSGTMTACSLHKKPAPAPAPAQ